MASLNLTLTIALDDIVTYAERIFVRNYATLSKKNIGTRIQKEGYTSGIDGTQGNKE